MIMQKYFGLPVLNIVASNQDIDDNKEDNQEDNKKDDDE